jgi:hypothetical protein
MAAKGVAAHMQSSKDMRAAFGLCQKAGKDAVILLVDQEKCLGLQFYLDGPVKRVTRRDKKSWADDSLEGSLRKLKESGAGPPHAYLVRDKRAKNVQKAIQETRLSYRQYTSKFWVLYVVEPQGPRAAGPGAMSGAPGNPRKGQTK